jgi:hypothetical protein
MMFGTLGTPILGRQDGWDTWAFYQSTDRQFEIMTTSGGLPGDELWTLYGMKWPVVLRRTPDRTTTSLLAIAMARQQDGQAHGLMFGTAVGGKEGQV